MPQCDFQKRMVSACAAFKRNVAGEGYCSSARLAEEHFFKKWLGICKLFSSISPLREKIGVKS
jgi:hypothetical protein